VPWPDTKVIGISRSPSACDEDLRLDLSDPESWPQVERSFRDHLEDFEGDNVAFFHAAADLRPLGFAGEVDPVSYYRSVLLNSAAPQVLGNLFLTAVKNVTARRFLVLVTSAGAGAVVTGATAYGTGKTALNQWVRIAGAEQAQRSGTQVLAIGPGDADNKPLTVAGQVLRMAMYHATIGPTRSPTGSKSSTRRTPPPGSRATTLTTAV
jgi:NAD(P)-dependent dehydrogenase (short-subunit alcohol dehydrogenase family)